MKNTIHSWKKLWKDLGTRRWLFLLLVGVLLVVIAMPVGSQSSKGGQQGGTADSGANNVIGGADGGKNNSTGTTGPGATGSRTVSDYEEELEKRLTEILSQIEGAGQVHVMVTVKRSSELILQSDTSREESTVRETDSQGGVRDNAQIREDSQTVLTGGSGTSQPYVVGEIMPQVEGVVVACEGGDRPSIQAEISAAVQALFDLQPHKIKVCKMASP